MTQLTDSFHLGEFAQPERHGFEHQKVPGEYIENVRRLCSQVLQPLRNHVATPISILSGYRSPAYNRYVGGARMSQHLIGTAADIRVRGWSPTDVHREILRLRKAGFITVGGLGLYERFVHIDVREGKKRMSHWSSPGMRDVMRANVKATR